MNVLQTIDLKKQYGSEPNIARALDGVNLSVEQGEFVSIIGTSGSGKSTLLNMLGGLDIPTSGSVKIRGREIGQMNDEQLTVFRRRNIGFVFQNYSLMPVLNVYDNVAIPVTFDRGNHVSHKYIEELLRELGIWEKRKKYPNELSG